MPKPASSTSTKSKPSSSVTEQTFDMSIMYKSFQDMTTKLSQQCLKNIPEELPEDKDKVNKMYEIVRDGYIELSRLKELTGTTLREFSEVMRRLAESRAKANACAEIETEPPQAENVLNDESVVDVEDVESDDEKKADDEKPKKKDKKEKTDKKKKTVEPEEHHSEDEPEPEPETKSKKDKKKKTVEPEEHHSEDEPEPEPETKSKKDKKKKTVVPEEHHSEDEPEPETKSKKDKK